MGRVVRGHRPGCGKETQRLAASPVRPNVMDESRRQQAPLSGKPSPELGWKLGMWAGYETHA